MSSLSTVVALASTPTRTACSATWRRAGPLDHKGYTEIFRAALVKAEITDEVRPFHDGRHTSITNAAAAGVAPDALQARAGYADLGTTQRYIDLAGVLFRDEAEAAEARMFGPSSTDE